MGVLIREIDMNINQNFPRRRRDVPRMCRDVPKVLVKISENYGSGSDGDRRCQSVGRLYYSIRKIEFFEAKI